MMVLLAHFLSSFTLLLPGMRFVESYAHGTYGVDIFFVLSGFILAYVYSAAQLDLTFASYSKFLWFRLARIYPNHIATLGVLIVMVAVGRWKGMPIEGDYPVNRLGFEFTLTQSWPIVSIAGFQGIEGWNYPSWSISAEWFAYLCMFPLCWLFLLRHYRLYTYVIMCYVALGVWVELMYSGRLPSFVALTQVSCEFVAGSALFGVYSTSPTTARFFQQLLAGTTALIIVVLSPLFAKYDYVRGAFIFLIPPLLLGLTAETSVIARILSTRFALLLGRISYALYMSHAVVQKILKVLLPSQRYAASPLFLRTGILITDFLLIFTSASLLYYFVEIPCRNLMRVWFQKWHLRKQR